MRSEEIIAIRQRGIRDAKASNIPPKCEYATCGGCGNDTIIDKSGLCEACFASGL
jgi:hypothetical protein